MGKARRPAIVRRAGRLSTGYPRTRGQVRLSAVGEPDASRRDGEYGDLHRFDEDRSLVVTVGAFRAGDDVEVSEPLRSRIRAALGSRNIAIPFNLHSFLI